MQEKTNNSIVKDKSTSYAVLKENSKDLKLDG